MSAQQRRVHPPMDGRHMSGEKAKDFKGTSSKLLKYMRKDLVVIIIAFVLAIGGVVATVTTPDILSEATDVLVVGAMKKTVYNELVPSLKFSDEALAVMDAYPTVSIALIKDLIKQEQEEGSENSILKDVPRK